MRATFFWRLYTPVVALILMSTIAVGLWMEHFVRDDMLRDLGESLRARAVLLSEIARPYFDGPIDAGLEQRVRELGHEGGARLTVIRADGVVLADSEKDPAVMDNHLRRPEVQAARESGEGQSQRSSETTGIPYLYFARLVKSDGPPLGYVRAAFPLETIQGRIAGLRATVAVTALVTIVLAGLVALYFTRRVSRPLTAMTELAEGIARGERPDIHHMEGADEIRRLAEAMRSMTAQLEERLDTITGDRNKLVAIFASMVEGLIAVDKDQRVVHVNSIAARLLDLGPDSVLGKHIWEVTRVLAVCKILESSSSHAREESGECRVAPSVQGRPETVIELRASPLRDGNGQLAGAVVVLHDVTALRRLETMRRDFVANVSHELKTPLTAIRGLVETMLDDRAMPDETERRFLEKIRDQSHRLSAIVTDLLTLARIESNETRVERKRLDVRNVVRESASRFAEACASRGLSFASELPPEPVMLVADEEALRQIVDNLLDNACKYTPTGGAVSVRIVRDAGETRIEVTDTGIGIALADQERVFERFYRVDKARSRELGGTGLGLSIVKHLVQGMGARVSLDSDVGRGSTFRVHIPGDGEAS